MPFSNGRWRIATIRKILLTAISMFSGFVLFMYWNAHKRNVIYHEMTICPNNQEGKSNRISIFFISDIHRRKIDSVLISKVLKFGKPDLVIIGGDLAEGSVPKTRINENVRLLSALGPAFYVWGNNDREIGEDTMTEILKKYQVKILENENVSIPGHPTWGLCGTEDPSSRKVDVATTLRYIDQYEHIIVASHTPSVLRKVEEMTTPDLMLSGHTHGGQIRVGKFGLQDKGEFQINGKSAKLISNGYGTSTLPLRLGADPECHFIVVDYM